MMKSLSCISALILSAALLVLVSAQPSGTFLSESYHAFPDCNINSTYYFYLTRYGSDVTCQPSTNGFTYRSCNASHRLEYTCTDSLCTQDCNLTSVQELNTCTPSEGYYIARCLIRDAPGWLPSALSSIASNQAFWLGGRYQEQNPPTCNISGNGLRSIESAGSGTAAGCVPNIVASNTYSYSTCNDTGNFLWTCSDNQCTQDCVLSSTETPVACPSTNETQIFNKFCYTIPPAPVAAPEAAPVQAPVAAPTSGASAPVSAPVSSGQAPTASNAPVATAAPVAAPKQSAPVAPKAPSSSSESILAHISIMSFVLTTFVAVATL